MRKSMNNEQAHAGDIVGYWRGGRPIYLPGGGSTPPEPTTLPTQVTPSSGNVTVTLPPAPTAPPQTLTTADLEAERTRLQQDFDARMAAREAELQRGFNERLGPIEAERAQREQEAQAARDAAAEAERQRVLAEESAAQRAERMAQETQNQLASLQQEIATRDALLAREAEYNRVQEYRREQIQSHNETIYPALINTIVGNTTAEIDAAIGRAEAASMEILSDTANFNANAAAADAAARRQAPGVSATLPAAGPLEMQQQTRELTPEQIKNLDPAEYAALRSQLLGRGANPRADRGIFS